METAKRNDSDAIAQDGDFGDGEEVNMSHYFKAAEEQALTEPWSVRRRVKGLKKLLARGMEIESKFYDEISALERQYESQFQPLYAKRLEIISGKREPKDEECDFPEESDATYELLKKARNENKGSEGDESIDGIPQFWLTAMKNVGVLAEMIESHDEAVLQYLDDLTVELTNNPPGFKLNFYFGPNEYFPHPVLTKTYTMKNDVDEKDPLSYDGPEITNCQGSTISWKDGKNVTQIIRQKKVKDKTGGLKIVQEKFKVPSFFDFFSPPQIPSDPNFEMDEEILVQLTRDFDIGQFIRETFVPRAVMHYTGEAEATDHGSDDDEDEDDDGEGDDDDDTDYEGISDASNNVSSNVGKEPTKRVQDPYDE